LGRVRDKTGLAVLDLRLERAYHIDLGFALNGCEGERAPGSRVRPTLHGTYVPQRLDRALAQTLSDGLPLVPQTFARAGEQLGCSEADVIGRLHVLVESGIVPRIGVIVRHRALGWRSNAMVVWDAPRDQADRAGEVLAEAPGINLCYRRTRYEREWPYSLYCMVHARSRDEALAKLVIAEALAGLQGVPRQILFSTRCYRQTGAMLGLPREAA
jgi:DNA-binding Lrp family transcriptional regulator